MVSERRVFLICKGGRSVGGGGVGNSRPHQSAYTSISVGPFATCVCDGGGKALGTVGEGRTGRDTRDPRAIRLGHPRPRGNNETWGKGRTSASKLASVSSTTLPVG